MEVMKDAICSLKVLKQKLQAVFQLSSFAVITNLYGSLSSSVIKLR